MATPPTRVGLFASVFNSTATPKTTTLTGIQVGDVVALFVVVENNDAPEFVFTPTATGVTWTLRATVGGTTADRCFLQLWTGVVGTAGSPTLSVSRDVGAAGYMWGIEATVWRNHGGIGVFGSNSTGTSGAPSVSLTTAVDSAVQCFIGDWNAPAVGARTWLTINGITPTAANLKETLASAVGPYTLWSAYWDDTDAAANSVGMSAPSTMRYSIAAVEVLGAATETPVAAHWLLRPPGRRAPSTRRMRTFPGAEEAVAAGAQSVDVDPAVLVLSGVDPDVAGSGAASVTVDVAALTLTGVDPAAAGSGSATQPVDVAALTLTGTDLTASGSGSPSLTVDPATLALAGQDAAATATGAASVAVDPAALTLSGQTPTAAGSGATSVTVDSATLTLTGIDSTVAGTGAATVTPDPAVLTLTGETPTAAGTGSAATTVDVSVLVLSGVEVTAATGGGGPQAVDVDPATLSLVGLTPAADGSGATALSVDVAALTLAGIDLAALGSGQAAIVADSATLTLTGIDPGVAGTGASSTSVDSAVLTLVGVEVVAASLTADPSPITLTLRESGHTATIRGERTTQTVRSQAATTVRAHPTRLTLKQSTHATVKEN